MKSTVVDESLSSYKPMYCSREYQTSTRLNQQYEKSTLNSLLYMVLGRVGRDAEGREGDGEGWDGVRRG